MLKRLACEGASSFSRKSQVIAGCLASSLAYLLFCIQDAGVSKVAKSVSIADILFVRSATIIGLCLIIGRRRLVVEALRVKCRARIAVRAGLIVLAWCLFYDASRYMPFSNLMVLYDVSPIIVIVLSCLVLGEKPTVYIVICILLGFLGAILSTGTNTKFDGYLAPSLAALAAAGLWACSVILMRQVASQAPILAQIFLTSATMLVLSTPMVSFQQLELDVALVTAALGIASACGQWLIILSARVLPAAVMAALEYVSILWAFLIALLIWEETPHVSAALGAVLVCGSGVAIAIAEAYRKAA